MKALIISLVLLVATLSINAQTSSEITGKKVIIETNYGVIEILLYDSTPLHRDNFIKLTKEGFYKDLLFHRVIKNFMIQGGDPNSRNATKGELLGGSGPGYTIPAEIVPSLYHKKGAIAAARQGDQVNPMKASSGSQFYIVTGNLISIPQLNHLAAQGGRPPFTEEQIKDYTTIGGAPHLDGAYTVFGEVTKGLDILDKISQMATDSYNRPIEDVKFTIKLVE